MWWNFTLDLSFRAKRSGAWNLRHFLKTFTEIASSLRSSQ
ncbi:conserved hypothetical protein [Chryseobacterium sp. 8AT]|nr:conserved hypothetical protein [Chryseobacterium sp. 8AT]